MIWPSARTTTRSGSCAFTRAAQIQAGDDGQEGGDPPAIWYPMRRSLAAAMLMGGDAAGAVRRHEVDLDTAGAPESLEEVLRVGNS